MVKCCVVKFDCALRSKEVNKRRAPGNGLRQFAMSVLLKVERKGRTSYNEVADELVRDAAFDYRSRARAPQVTRRSLTQCCVVFLLTHCDLCPQTFCLGKTFWTIWFSLERVWKSSSCVSGNGSSGTDATDGSNSGSELKTNTPTFCAHTLNKTQLIIIKVGMYCPE